MSGQTSRGGRRPFGGRASSGAVAWATPERVLVALVAVGIVWRSVAALDAPVPWILPDEAAYALLGRGVWDDGELSILGGPTPYLSVLYPLLAGLPLELGGLGGGYDVLRVLQAVVLCSTAVVVFAWARSLVQPWWALAAAAPTLALPGLTYAGTLTPDVLLVPLVSLAAWQSVRTLEAPTRANQALLVGSVLACVLARPEGHVVGLAVVAGAVVRGRVRELTPTWIAFGAGAAAWLALGGGPPYRSLGGYGEAGAYTPLRILELVAEHAGLLLLVSAIVPLAAAVLLALTRPPEPALRSTLAVVLSLAAAAAAEAGVFAAGHADRLVERNLFFALPPVFVAFAAWLGVGAPRPRRWALAVAATAFAALIALPIGALAVPEALADNPSLAPLIDVSSPRAYALTALAAAVACVLLVWLPARLRWVLPAATTAALLVASVWASGEFADRSRLAARTFGGPTVEWIDRATGERAALLYDGGPAWQLVWAEALRNERLARVLDLTPTRVPGPLPQGQLQVPGDDGGLVLVGGGAPSERVFVTPQGLRLDGRLLARKQPVGTMPGRALWEASGAPRVQSWAQGVLPNGDIGGGGTATLEVFGCGRGTFRLVVVGRDDSTVTLAHDGTTVASSELWPRGVWEQTLETDGDSGRCTFSVSATSLVNLSTFSWTPRR